MINRRRFIYDSAKGLIIPLALSPIARAASIVAFNPRVRAVSGPDTTEDYTDLKTYSGDNAYVYAAGGGMRYPGAIANSHGPSCITQTVVISSGTGWTPGTYTVDACVVDFSVTEGSRDLLRLTATPAAAGTGGGVGYINGGAKLLVIAGDSIARGNNASAELLTPPWRTYVGLGGAATWKVHNRGVSGRTSATVLSNYSAEMGVLYDGTKTKRVFLLHICTNDLANSTSAATCFSNLQSIGNLAKASGYQVILDTILPRTDGAKGGGFDAAAATLNASIRGAFDTATANARVFLPHAGTTWADMLVDLAANAHLANSDDLTYFKADKLHPNDTGCQVMADDWVAGINLLP